MPLRPLPRLAEADREPTDKIKECVIMPCDR